MVVKRTTNAMAGSRADHESSRKLQVLALGLPRTGSSSIAAALTILGYNNVLHCTNIDSPEFWSIMNRAADS
ncbi:hypothetical protein F5B19DRAFT_468070 [Rostrohypoxylon terebratum]|nr:hypothetical protein F5B19DRAFT_468070 [Rostrohypoxylon terebratum]